jgi:lipopolysaccharide assembly protein A
MRIILILFYVLIILFGVTFAALNSNAMTVNLYFMEYTLPSSVLLFITFCFGLLVGLGMSLARIMHYKYKLKHAQKDLNLMEKELVNLRVLPLKDQH